MLPQKIKTIVVEDEEAGMDNIVLKIERYCPELEIVAKCHTGEAAIKAIREKRPQLIFLDIMLGTMTGFDVLEKIKQVNLEVIFTTSSDEYGIEATNANAAYYILKPVRPTELTKATQAALLRIQQQGDISRILVPDGNSQVVIQTKDIMYCIADNVNTYIHRKEERPFLVVKTLKSIEAMLPLTTFHRVSRKALVNIDYVESFHRSDGGYIVMKNQKDIPVTKSRLDSFLKKLSGTF